MLRVAEMHALEEGFGEVIEGCIGDVFVAHIDFKRWIAGRRAEAGRGSDSFFLGLLASSILYLFGKIDGW